MLSILLTLILAGTPVYFLLKKLSNHKLNKKLTQFLGEDFMDEPEPEPVQEQKKSWWRQRFDIANEFYTPDFILIYGMKKTVVSITITAGYVIFSWFFCFTLDISFPYLIVMLTMVISIASMAIYNNYKNAFSNYFEGQFPYALRLISRNLAVGQTIYMAVDAAAMNLNDIMQREFKRISNQLKSGTLFEDVLDAGEKIYPYKGYYVFSSYLKVSLQKGSSLKDTLLSLADDLISAQIIKKKTRALTSESRGAAVILAFLPVIMLIVMRLFNTENFYYLFEATYGRYVIIYVVISVSLGFYIISRMIKKVEL